MANLIKYNNSIIKVDSSIKVANKYLQQRNDIFLIPYRKGDKWGFSDRNRKIVIPCIYDRVNFFIEGLAVVGNYIYQNQIWWEIYCIDINGKAKLTLTYSIDNIDSIKLHPFNLIELDLDLFYKRLININGDEITSYSSIENFKEDFAIVCNTEDADYFDEDPVKEPNDLYGIIDKYGKDIIEPTYDFIRDYKEGFFGVKLDKKWGFIDQKGHVVIPLIYDEVASFSEGLAAIKLYKKWGFIDKKGNTVIPLIYDKVKIFSEGLAAVKLNRKWGFINKDGELVIPFEFEKTNQFNNGFASVKLFDGVWILINKKGLKVKWPREFGYSGVFGWFNSYGQILNNMGNLSEGYLGLKEFGLKSENKKWGFFNPVTYEFIPPIYEKISQFSEGLAAVKLNNKWGFINKNGETVIQFIYEDIGNILSNDLHSFNSKGLESLFEQKRYFYRQYYYDECIISGDELNIDSLGNLDLKDFGFKNSFALVLKENGPIVIDKNGNEFFE
jgi:hypothetical protein